MATDSAAILFRFEAYAVTCTLSFTILNLNFESVVKKFNVEPSKIELPSRPVQYNQNNRASAKKNQCYYISMSFTFRRMIFGLRILLF